MSICLSAEHLTTRPNRLTILRRAGTDSFYTIWYLLGKALSSPLWVQRLCWYNTIGNLRLSPTTTFTSHRYFYFYTTKELPVQIHVCGLWTPASSYQHLETAKLGESWTLTAELQRRIQGMDMFPVHQVCPKLSWKAQWKGEEDKADRERGGKTISGNRQAWSSSSPRGQWRTRKNGENWL